MGIRERERDLETTSKLEVRIYWRMGAKKRYVSTKNNPNLQEQLSTEWVGGVAEHLGDVGEKKVF